MLHCPTPPSDASRPAPSSSSTRHDGRDRHEGVENGRRGQSRSRQQGRGCETRRAATSRTAPRRAATAEPSKRAPSRARDDKDRPLFEDIRFLGRLLGEVLREQEGDAVFDVVEAIRQTAVKFRREDDGEASQTLEKRLRAADAGTDGERRARVQLFLASREHRGRPASQPPPPHSRARRLRAAGRHDRLCDRAHAAKQKNAKTRKRCCRNSSTTR